MLSLLMTSDDEASEADGCAGIETEVIGEDGESMLEAVVLKRNAVDFGAKGLPEFDRESADVEEHAEGNAEDDPEDDTEVDASEELGERADNSSATLLRRSPHAETEREKGGPVGAP